MTEHTPGPWRTGENDNGSDLAVFAAGQIVADCEFPAHDNEAHANARLIAAAPDMLAILQKFITAFDADKAPGLEVWDAARNIIAKVTGHD